MSKVKIVAVVVIVAVVAIGFVAIFSATQPAADMGDAFMNALKAGDYARAFDLCSPQLQAELKSAEEFEKWLKANQVQPVSWAFTSREISTSAAGATAQLKGSVALTGDRQASLELNLTKVGDEWLVLGFFLN